MRPERIGERAARSAEASAAPAAGPDGRDLLVREQAAAIAHYKKMYDRSSALARIGVWEYDLIEATLTWTDGVYDLFELPRGSELNREEIVALYEEDSRRDMERMRAQAIEFGGNFTPRHPDQDGEGQSALAPADRRRRAREWPLGPHLRHQAGHYRREGSRKPKLAPSRPS